MTSVDTSDYAGDDRSTACEPEPATDATTACPEQTTTPTSPAASAPEISPASAVTSGGGGSSIAPAVATSQSDPAAVVAPTVAAAAGATTTVSPTAGSGTTPSVAAVDNLGAVLGQVATAFGQAVTGALTAAVETVPAGSGSTMFAAPTSTNSGLFDAIAGLGSRSGEHASITVGDTVIDIEAGDDSMTVTVHAPGGGGETTVFAISADGTIEEVEPKVADTQQESAECDTDEATGSSAQVTDDTVHEPVPPPTPGVTEDPTTDEPATGKAGSPDVVTAPECAVTVPPARYVPDETTDGDRTDGTPVAPQSSEPDEPVPPDGGLLALAGEQ
jgi:hypothetical protein